VAAKAAANGAGATGDTAPTAVESKSCINVNTADAAQLEDLPGIGPALAGRIVEYRQKHGAFKKGADLTQVKGIGKVKLEKMEPRICF
jgi:competence protein ComEA